jgi:acetate---CoA ligase (ADP-forming)
MDLGRLLAPRSIAVVGATDRPDSYGGNVLRNLDRAGYRGEVWGVNPKRDRVLGRACFPTVDALPEPVDALVVAVPAVDVAPAVRAGAERGCGGAIVLSAGFAESDSGVGYEAELLQVARDHGLPVCGPNGNGIVAVAERAAIWGDGLGPIDPGPVAMVTQSGNVGVNALGSRRGIGWHTVVSTGNQTVCAASDWLAALAERDGVRSIALFLESDDDGARLADALAVCAERRVGVAVLKVGSSEAGARAAAAHTGSLAGDQRVFKALVEEAGAAWAEDFHDLLELAKALAEPGARPSGSGGLAVLTCSGGDSGVAGDRAADLGLELPALSASTVARLGELLPDAATIANPLDYTALIWGDDEKLAEIVRTVGADGAIGQLLLLYDHPRDLSPESEADWAAVRRGLATGAGDCAAAAIVASTLPDLVDPDANRELAEQRVPVVGGLATGLRCVLALRRPAGDPGRIREIAAAAELAAAASSTTGLSEGGAKELLRGAGVAVPPGREVDEVDEAVTVASEVGWPVALKLSAPEVLHKSDEGALVLNVGDEGELRAAWSRLAALPAAAGARILVERMADPGVEVLVSARADAVVPALTIGLGGIWTEALGDVAVLALPATKEAIKEQVLELRGAPVLSGGRGSRGVDLDALAALAARVGELLLERGLRLIELNPVLVGGDGSVAVDALIR